MGFWPGLVRGSQWRGLRQARQLALWIFCSPLLQQSANVPRVSRCSASSPIFIGLTCANAASNTVSNEKAPASPWFEAQMRLILSCPCRDQRGGQGSSPRLHATAKYPGQALRFPQTWISRRLHGQEAWTNLAKRNQPCGCDRKLFLLSMRSTPGKSFLDQCSGVPTQLQHLLGHELQTTWILHSKRTSCMQVWATMPAIGLSTTLL